VRCGDKEKKTGIVRCWVTGYFLTTAEPHKHDPMSVRRSDRSITLTRLEV